MPARTGRAYPSRPVSGGRQRFGVVPPTTAAITGTATAGINEADIVAGGKTIIITLTNDTWVAAGATFDNQRQNIINGIDSAQSETNGWDAQVKPFLALSDVVRTSGTVVTITLDAVGVYNITATETITVTVPSSALVTSLIAVIGSPTFTITSGAATYFITPTGAITPTATLIKRTSKPLVGAATPAGTMAKILARTFTAGATPAGVLAKRLSRTYTAAVTPAGALVRSLGKALAGAVTPAATLRRSIARTLTAGITPTGALRKSLSRTFVAGITPIGVLTKLRALSFAGAITPAGSLLKQIQKAFTGGIGGPRTSVSDTFTDTATTLLESHVGELGASWTNVNGSSPTLQISNANRLRNTGNAEFAFYQPSGTPTSPEYDVEADIYVADTSTAFVALFARWQPDNSTFYQVYRDASSWTLYKFVAGTPTLLGDSVVALSAAVTYHVKLEIRDATKKVFVDSVEVISSADNAILPAGVVRVQMEADTAGNTSGMHLDNFVVTSVHTLYGSLLLEVVENFFEIVLSGAVTPAATLIKSLSRTYTAGVTPTGVLAKLRSLVFAGSITPAATLVKSVAKSLAGAITPSGTVVTIRVFLRSFSGAITPAGALTKSMLKALAGAITPSGVLTASKVLLRSFAGSVTPSATLVMSLAKSFAGALTPTGTVTTLKVFLRTFAGAITPSGAIVRQVGKSLTGGATPAGTLVRSFTHTFSGALTPTGTVLKRIARTFAGGVTPSGVLTTARVILLSLAGAITPSGTLRRQVNKALAGVVSSSGTLARTIGKVVAGAITPAGSIAKVHPPITLTGTIAPVGTLRKLIVRLFGGNVTPAATVITQVNAALPDPTLDAPFTAPTTTGIGTAPTTTGIAAGGVTRSGRYTAGVR